ncbi:MAG: glycoside hydrolase family 44 protein [candidate division FCPU426 bacterium]
MKFNLSRQWRALALGCAMLGTQASPAAMVSLGKTLGPIDPRIYGTNFTTEAALNTKSIRFGGNGVSRSNPLNGKYNNSFDWDFSNTGHVANEPGGLYAAQRAIGAEPLVQAQLLGYLAGDRSWGSVKVDPARFSADLVRDLNITKKLGIKYWALDNEADCWQGTHKDVWHHQLGYDEYLERYFKTAEAMKAVDPSIKLFGPVSANRYFYFQLNREEDKAKGPWIPYFLKRCREHDAKWGQRSVDYLDIHRYPDAGKDDAATLEVARDWWDPAYDKDPVIPTMKRWIDDYYPGTQLSISEYSLGYSRKIVPLIYIAQSMGTFGRLGVANANKWGVEQDEKLVFGLYANLFGDQALEASSDDKKLEVFASRGSRNGDICLVLINKDLKNSVALDLKPGERPEAQDAYVIQENAEKKPVLSHQAASAYSGRFNCPPLSITLLRLWLHPEKPRPDFKTPAAPPVDQAAEANKLKGGGYPFAKGSGYYFYHPSVISRDLAGRDSFLGSGDTGLDRGGARDQVPTKLGQDHGAQAPADALVFFDNSDRTSRWMEKTHDALLFDFKHRAGGWTDIRVAHDLQWLAQDIGPYVKSGGALVFYVKDIQGQGTPMTVYIENNKIPERILSLQSTDYVAGAPEGGWQRIRIPLKDFELEEQGIDLAHVRYVGFGNGLVDGHVLALVDDIMFVKGQR